MKKICTILIYIYILLISLVAQEQLQKTVRIGFFSFDGYHMEKQNGIKSGYGYDIIQHFVGYTNWKYEYVGYNKSWEDMLEMLKNGEIDMLSSAQKTPARLKDFDFSDTPIGQSSTLLTVKAGNRLYTPGDYENWNGITVGMIKANTRNDSFSSFAKEKNFSYIPIFFDTVDQMVQELKTGSRINAILTSNLRSIDDEWILAEFDTSPFYVIVRKNNQELLFELNNAIFQMYMHEPDLNNKLMKKYYAVHSGPEIAFTAQERDFIYKMQHSIFSALIDPDRPPFSKETNGVIKGIIKDIAEIIIERSNLNFIFITPKNRNDYKDLIDSEKVDIEFDADYDLFTAEKHSFRLTIPYLKDQVVMLHKKNNKNKESIAIIKDSDIAVKYKDYFESNFSSIIYYDSVSDVINAIKTGKQDVAFTNKLTADLAIQEDVTNKLMLENFKNEESSFSIGVNAKTDAILYSILNKIIGSIEEETIDEIIKNNTPYKRNRITPIGIMYNHPIVVVLVLSLIFIIIAFVIILVIIARKRKNEKALLNNEYRMNSLLKDALSAAEKADMAKNQFLSRVSHEMRTPLNAIIGFLELAKDAPPDQISTYLTNSNLSAKQLLSVINDILDMSAIESGKLKLAQSSFDFKRLISSITNIYFPLCKQKGLNYETKILTPIDEWLVGDQIRVNQILMNLLNNAVKFTSEGYIYLKIAQYNSVNNELFIRLEIEDTGMGMSEEMQTRLFKPFEQESAYVAQKFGGSGLGLSIVKNLVSLMDGAIRVQSTPGVGSIFTIDIPFIRSNLHKSEFTTEGSDHIRVLSIDDEENDRKYVSIVLSRLGIRHTNVSNCQEALIELQKGIDEEDTYNVCLVDWKMPNIDGIETTKQIRKLYGSDVVVIIVSAYENSLESGIIKESGANLFLSKPLFQSTLFDLFMTLTNGKVSHSNKRISSYQFNGRKILLAEDNSMNKIVAEGLLKKLGIEFESANDGQQAVDIFLKHEAGYFDAILMDIQMPIMDGFEATSTIRNSKHPDANLIQIIALTANAFNEDIAKTLSSGMNAHVAKPIEHEIFAKALENAFQVSDKNKESRQL